MNCFKVGDLVLLSTGNLPEHAVSNLGSSKLLPRFIGPFRVLKCNGSAYTLDVPTSMRLHPTFYVGRLKPYLPSGSADPTSSFEGEPLAVEGSRPAREESPTHRSEVASRHRGAGGHQRIGPSQTRQQRGESRDHREECPELSQPNQRHQEVKHG